MSSGVTMDRDPRQTQMERYQYAPGESDIFPVGLAAVPMPPGLWKQPSGNGSVDEASWDMAFKQGIWGNGRPTTSAPSSNQASLISYGPPPGLGPANRLHSVAAQSHSATPFGAAPAVTVPMPLDGAMAGDMSSSEFVSSSELVDLPGVGKAAAEGVEHNAFGHHGALAQSQFEFANEPAASTMYRDDVPPTADTVPPYKPAAAAEQDPLPTYVQRENSQLPDLASSSTNIPATASTVEDFEANLKSDREYIVSKLTEMGFPIDMITHALRTSPWNSAMDLEIYSEVGEKIAKFSGKPRDAREILRI
jgi:hypothetical protein